LRRHIQKRFAEEAARFMAEGCEGEYLQAKERAMMMLGLSSQNRLPSNKKVRGLVGRLTRASLGEGEVERRLFAMRAIAIELMVAVEDFDPFLIGSTLSGEIHQASDIDLHVYSDAPGEISDLLGEWGYEDIEEEEVHNLKGKFVHLRFNEKGFAVEMTVYPWSWRDVVPQSSITGKAMKRADIGAVRALTTTANFDGNAK
jgi:hypothetical protein